MQRTPEPRIHFDERKAVGRGVPAILHHRDTLEAREQKLGARVGEYALVPPAFAQRGHTARPGDLVQAVMHELGADLAARAEEESAHALPFDVALHDRPGKAAAQRKQIGPRLVRALEPPGYPAAPVKGMATVQLDIQRRSQLPQPRLSGDLAQVIDEKGGGQVQGVTRHQRRQEVVLAHRRHQRPLVGGEGKERKELGPRLAEGDEEPFRRNDRLDIVGAKIVANPLDVPFALIGGRYLGPVRLARFQPEPERIGGDGVDHVPRASQRADDGQRADALRLRDEHRVVRHVRPARASRSAPSPSRSRRSRSRNRAARDRMGPRGAAAAASPTARAASPWRE